MMNILDAVKYSKIQSEISEDSLCIFAAYDARSEVQPYVYHLLAELQVQLSAHVVYVTTSKELSDADKAKLDDKGISVVHRENLGYDFGSYYTGFESLKSKIATFDYIYHANDSVFGPFASIADVVTKMQSSPYDVWGMTDSWEYKYHVQSYFICFNKAAHAKLAEFWDGFTFSNDYAEVVHNGELGMSQYFLHSALNIGAAFPIEKYAQERLPDEQEFKKGCRGLKYWSKIFSKSKRKKYLKKMWDRELKQGFKNNPTFYSWRSLLRDGQPFLKKRVLSDWHLLHLHAGDWFTQVPDEFMESKQLTLLELNQSRPSIPKKYNS